MADDPCQPPPVLAYDPRAGRRPSGKWPPYGWTGLVMAAFGAGLIGLSVYPPGREPVFCLFAPIGIVALFQAVWLSSAGLFEAGRSRWPSVFGFVVALGGAAIVVSKAWPFLKVLIGR